MFLFSYSYRLCTINAQANLFMLCQHNFTTKTLRTALANVFFVFILRFVKNKSVKIFDIHIMWLAFISYKEQIYRIFKFLISNVDWKQQLVFITNRKLNPIIIKVINKFLPFSVILSGCIFTELIYLTWHYKKYFWSLFFMLISPFFELFNSAGNFM